MKRLFWQPLHQLYFYPAEFCLELRYRRELWRALCFGVSFLSLSWFARELWQAVWYEDGIFPADLLAAVGGEILWDEIPPAYSLLLELILYPALALSAIAALALFFHLLTRLAGGRYYSFAETLQLTAYAAGASGVLSLVPLTGPFFGTLAFIFFLYCGFHYTFHLGKGRAAAAAIFPYFLLGLVLLAGMALLTGLLLFKLGAATGAYLAYPGF